MSGRIKEVPLFSNILFVLEDAGINCESNEAMARQTDQITDLMKREIKNEGSRSSMYFLNASTGKKMSMPLSEIAIDEGGDPKFAAATYKAPYAGSMVDFMVYGWETKRGEVLTACHPAIAFYPDEKQIDEKCVLEKLPSRRLIRG